MKIGLVCPYNMMDRPGGVQQLVTHLADGLRGRGHIVKIITPKPAGFNGEVPKDIVLLGNSTKFNPSPGLGTAGTWTFDISDKEVKQLIDKEQFDVIHFHEPWAPLLARQILNRSSEAHVATFHANLVDSMAGKSLFNIFTPYGRGIIRKMQIFTAVSEAPASIMLEKAKKSQLSPVEKQLLENIKYIPNGIDIKLYKPPKKRIPLSGPGTKTVLYVGRLEDRKGVSWLLKAFAELSKNQPKTHLIIAGDGKDRKDLEQQAAMLEIANIKFFGYVSDEEKRHLMGNADLVCAPAMHGESFGIVVAEAMASGAPILAGNNLGYRVVLRGRGRLGLIDAKSTEDFANRMALLLEDTELSNMLRRWGVKEAKQYDYPKIVDQYEAVYKEAIAIRAEIESKKSNAKDEHKAKKIINRVRLRRHS